MGLAIGRLERPAESADPDLAKRVHAELRHLAQIAAEKAGAVPDDVAVR